MKERVKKIMALDQIPMHLREAVCEEMFHSLQVSNLAVLVAEELGETADFCHQIEIAGILHDIGKLKLTQYLYGDGLMVEQMKYVRQHTEYSYEIAKNAGYDDEIAYAVYYHHENYDGTGYPDGVRGEDIPWMARILRVCDVFSALTADRNYRDAFDPKSALEIMIDEVEDYDMRVFLAFQRVMHEHVFKEGLEQLRFVCHKRQFEPIQLFEKEVRELIL